MKQLAFLRIASQVTTKPVDFKTGVNHIQHQKVHNEDVPIHNAPVQVKPDKQGTQQQSGNRKNQVELDKSLTTALIAKCDESLHQKGQAQKKQEHSGPTHVQIAIKAGNPAQEKYNCQKSGKEDGTEHEAGSLVTLYLLVSCRINKYSDAPMAVSDSTLVQMGRSLP